jgi:hypothetical protein
MSVHTPEEFKGALEEARALAAADTWDPVDGVRCGLGELCDAVANLGSRVEQLEAQRLEAQP